MRDGTTEPTSRDQTLRKGTRKIWKYNFLFPSDHEQKIGNHTLLDAQTPESYNLTPTNTHRHSRWKSPATFPISPHRSESALGVLAFFMLELRKKYLPADVELLMFRFFLIESNKVSSNNAQKISFIPFPCLRENIIFDLNIRLSLSLSFFRFVEPWLIPPSTACETLFVGRYVLSRDDSFGPGLTRSSVRTMVTALGRENVFT